MRVLIIGSLGGELGHAASLAAARGAKLEQADDAATALARLRADARVDLVLVELPHDVGALVRAMAADLDFPLDVSVVASWADAS